MPGCYRSYRSDKDNPPCERPGCGHWMKPIRHISLVDCPSHDILMTTMLNGAAVMDAALLLITGNETCAQPQTSEHLTAVETMKPENVIILQNKVDLINIDAVNEYIGKRIPIPVGDFSSDPSRVLRSEIRSRIRDILRSIGSLWASVFIDSVDSFADLPSGRGSVQRGTV
ncbi:hypothetical protein BDR04DRAFT_1233832 [Suillus decipiens]|nr:hypothetical protein BDR04DRAFT_1233832 [Suillus decipiens]